MSLLAAPSIVRFASLMPVKLLVPAIDPLIIYPWTHYSDVVRQPFLPHLHVTLYRDSPMKRLSHVR